MKKGRVCIPQGKVNEKSNRLNTLARNVNYAPGVTSCEELRYSGHLISSGMGVIPVLKKLQMYMIDSTNMYCRISSNRCVLVGHSSLAFVLVFTRRGALACIIFGSFVGRCLRGDPSPRSSAVDTMRVCF